MGATALALTMGGLSAISSLSQTRQQNRQAQYQQVQMEANAAAARNQARITAEKGRLEAENLDRERSALRRQYADVQAGNAASLGALGVDIIAHTYAFPRTIMFSPAGLDIIYPKSNAKMIKQMMEQALVMSEYDKGYMPHQYSFLDRNRLVIGLSDYVVIPQADMMSGSMQSARIAMKLNKPLFVLPHRIGESEGTNHLLAQGKAQGIYNIDDFIESIFGASVSRCDDEVLLFCANNPSFEEAFARFGEKIYEYELEGKIMRESGTIRVP